MNNFLPENYFWRRLTDLDSTRWDIHENAVLSIFHLHVDLGTLMVDSFPNLASEESKQFSLFWYEKYAEFYADFKFENRFFYLDRYIVICARKQQA